TRIQMMRRVRLHELLVAAGGVTLNASGQIQIVHTDREMCPQDAIDTPDIAEALLNKPVGTSVFDKAAVGEPKQQVAATAYDNSKTASAAVNGSKPVKTTPDQALSDIGKIETYEVGDVRTGLGKDDPYIRPGDIVIVTEGEPIYMTGYLNAPREIVMKDNMTLVRAVAMAGGISRTAKSHEVYIYRQVKGKLGPEKLKFDYDAIK